MHYAGWCVVLWSWVQNVNFETTANEGTVTLPSFWYAKIRLSTANLISCPDFSTNIFEDLTDRSDTDSQY